MIISHTHRYIFIKSYKTAGTSLEAALSGHCGGEDVVTSLGDYKFNRDETGAWVHHAMNEGNFKQHDEAETIRCQVPEDVWNNYLKFSIARNPWDRAVSLFYWEKKRKPSAPVKKRFYHYLGVPFNEFAQTKRGFSAFIKGENWGNNDAFYVKDGELCVDFIIRYERLNEDFAQLCEKLGLPNMPIPQLKAGIRAKGHHYSELYDEETQAIVAARHINDIQLLGYQFETA
jgi:hypothetical protein